MPAFGHANIRIEGYDVSKENLDSLYDKNHNIFMSKYDLLDPDFLSLADTTRPTDLKPTDDFYQWREWDVYAGVQRRTYPKELYLNTGGVIQNYVRTMRIQESYSQHDLSNEVIVAMQAGNFGPLEDYMAKYSAMAAKEHAQDKTEEFWNIFNYGTLSAGHAHFNQSLPSGKIADASGNKIYDSKPLFVKSGGSEHPQSNLVTGTTFYNYTVSLAWSRANWETVRYHVRQTNNRDAFGRRFTNEPTHIFANFAMEQYIEPDFQSPVKDMDLQKNIRQNEIIRHYTPWLTDTDAWGCCDPKAMIKWIDNWRPMEIDIYRTPNPNIWTIRISTFHGWCIMDWHSAYWCNQAES